MSSIQLAEFVLWKSLKQKQKVEISIQRSLFSYSESEKVVHMDEMICRVCTSPADIPITNKINEIDILSAIRSVSCIWVSSSDSYPKYVCNNCFEELKVALTFKKKCESSANFFRQTQPQRGNSNSSEMVKHDFALIIQQMKERRLSSQNITSRKIYKKRHGTSNFQETDVIERDPNPFKVFKCRRCELTFDNKALLIQHRIQRNCISPPCPLCGKVVANLARHNKIVHLRTEKYTCHICGKISFSSGALRNHLLVHSDKCDFSCPLCPYKGKQQAYLTLHMRVHTGERPYLCSQCPLKFVNPGNLRKHQLTHSNKKFECSQCKKQFRLRKSLQEHYEAAHLNVRYRCSICSRDLWTRRKLLSHELKVHNREKHKLYDELYKVVLNDDKD